MRAAKGKKSLTYKGGQVRFSADLSTETWQARNEWQDIFNVQKSEKYATKNSLSSKAVIQNRRRNQEFPRQTKTKGILTTKPAWPEIIGGSLSGEKTKQNKKTKSNKD